MSTISVIIPTYNRRAFLLEALASISRQSRPVDQIIIWDDGSEDGTAAAVAQIDDPRVQYFAATNAGKSAALNRAMQHATGDYIWICDDDDLLVEDAAETLAAVLDAQRDVGVVGGSYARFTDHREGRQFTGPGYWPDLSTGVPLRHLLEDIFLFQNAMLVRRSCYDRVGPFREDLHRSIDYDMIVRLATRFPVHMVDKQVFLQRKHDGLRGPAAQRHAASHVENVWAKQDAEVFLGLRSHIPLSLLQAMYEGAPETVFRAACLQRGAAYARHGLWQEAMADFEAGVQSLPDAPLGETELGICRRAVSGKHGVTPPAEALDRLTQLRRGTLAGRDLAGGLGRGLLWSIRRAATDRDLHEALRLLRLLSRTGLRMQSAASATKPPLRERTHIPAAAYNW
ncbi:glycosyltransferase family 2 protein [Alloyangia pacifica]|uniref:glycosyltransferase family 2 protein n=1 Tax=Alloyangia pacifica TaxID=311180 RepID=UPI001CD4A88A|nr:glycosyltransferase [Alloyangia pacifica]MCA0997308.1 glycosyltransferase [Alloyangia pacifica]